MDWLLSHSGECEDGASYCDDLSCWCHTDVDYHETVQHPEYDPDALVLACDFYGIPQSSGFSQR